jgi:hypothetical protein
MRRFFRFLAWLCLAAAAASAAIILSQGIAHFQGWWYFFFHLNDENPWRNLSDEYLFWFAVEVLAFFIFGLGFLLSKGLEKAQRNPSLEPH